MASSGGCLFWFTGGSARDRPLSRRAWMRSCHHGFGINAPSSYREPPGSTQHSWRLRPTAESAPSGSRSLHRERSRRRGPETSRASSPSRRRRLTNARHRVNRSQEWSRQRRSQRICLCLRNSILARRGVMFTCTRRRARTFTVPPMVTMALPASSSGSLTVTGVSAPVSSRPLASTSGWQRHRQGRPSQLQNNNRAIPRKLCVQY